MQKKIFFTMAVIVIIVLIFTFAILTRLIDAGFNGIDAPRVLRPSLKAQSLVKNIFIADLHCDVLMWNRDLNLRNGYGHVDIPRLIDGNVALETFSIVSKTPLSMIKQDNVDNSWDFMILKTVIQLWPSRTWTSPRERALYQAEKLHNFSRASKGKLVIIKSAGDLGRYLELRKRNPSITAGLLAIEGAQVLEGDLNNIDVLFRAGFRMISPTHFFDNDISGSAHGVKKYGLTQKGKAMIRLMEQKGMIIDLAHASPRTIDDTLAMTTKPVMISHTGVRGVCDSVRNISDRHIGLIARGGGVIGITYFPIATCGNDIDSIVRSIRYAVKRAGIEHVGLGSDYDGFVTVPFDTTGMALLVDALMKDGFTDEEIRLIMGGNVLRLLKQLLPKG
jgi:membrane dipeptidase